MSRERVRKLLAEVRAAEVARRKAAVRLTRAVEAAYPVGLSVEVTRGRSRFWATVVSHDGCGRRVSIRNNKTQVTYWIHYTDITDRASTMLASEGETNVSES